MKVLVVAAEPTKKSHLAKKLRAHGCQVRVVMHQDALTGYANLRPDAVIVFEYAASTWTRGRDTFQRLQQHVESEEGIIIGIGRGVEKEGNFLPDPPSLTDIITLLRQHQGLS